MIEDAATIAWGYFMQGDLWSYFTYILNFYFPYGLFFWLVGFVIFIVIQLKTESLIYATIPLALYFVIISSIPNLIINAYALMAMRYVGFILVIISGYYLYTIIRGRT
jgi:hypothetical protein